MYVEEPPTFGIITALPKEYASVKILLENTTDIVVPGRTDRLYVLGEVPLPQGGKHCVVLALLPQMGTNMAGIWAGHMLQDFSSLQDIIMVGIAGGAPFPETPDEHVRLGDIVVSGDYGVIQFDFVKETIYERKPRPFPRPPSSSLLQSVKLLQAAEMKREHPWLPFIDQATSQLNIVRPAAVNDKLASSIDPEKIIPHPKDKKRHPNRPRIFVGPIAASNTLLKNPLLRDELRNQFGVKAIEMESSGIADATWDTKAGYLVIRGICDYCDTKKSDDWQDYAAIVAAAYMRALLASIPRSETYNADNSKSHRDIPSRQSNDIDIEAAH
jgi:nucleoside phosphorylase